MNKLLLSIILLIALAIPVGAQTWGGLEHDSDLRFINASAPNRSATAALKSDFTTVVIPRYTAETTISNTTTINPFEIIQTNNAKMVRWVIPAYGSSDVVHLTPQTFQGYDEVRFQYIGWGSSAPELTASASSTLQINSSIYPSIRKPAIFVPAKIESATGTTLSPAYQAGHYGQYRVSNPQSLFYIYPVATHTAVGATEEIIMTGRRLRIDD